MYKNHTIVDVALHSAFNSLLWKSTNRFNQFIICLIYNSFRMLNPRISLFLDSIATEISMNSEPTLIKVSSTTNSSIFFLFAVIFFLGLYFCTHFQTERWFRLIKYGDNLSNVLLKEKPKIYLQTITGVFWRCSI